MRKGLSKQREHRFSTANELSAALVEATGARASTPPPDDVPTVSELLMDAEDKTSEPVARSERIPATQPARSRRLWPVLAAAIALTGIGFLAVTALGKRGGPAALQPSPVVAAPKSAPEPAAKEAPVAPVPSPAVAAVSSAPPSASIEPAASAPPAPTSVPRRERGSRPEKSDRRPGTVAKRAGELWNKKDEL